MIIDLLSRWVNRDDNAIRDFHLAPAVRYKRVMMRPGFNPDQATDIRGDSWMLRLTPRPWRPYLRLLRADRPIGTWLLLLPCLWSVTMAAKASGADMPPAAFVALFALGAFVMRGAGCVINDLWDRDIDGQVARTAQRPIASGEVPVRVAIWFLGALFVGRPGRAGSVQRHGDHVGDHVACVGCRLSVDETNHLLAAGVLRPDF